MNKSQLTELANSLNLPKTDYYIASGGALVLYGLRERTNDLDIYVTPELFSHLSTEYNIDPNDTDEYNSYHILNGRVQILISEHPTRHSTIFNNYPVETLDRILEFKLWRNAAKDQPDIKAIQEYLATHPINKTSHP